MLYQTLHRTLYRFNRSGNATLAIRISCLISSCLCKEYGNRSEYTIDRSITGTNATRRHAY